MKHISKEEFIEWVKSRDFNLKSSHDKLCFPIIYRIYRKMIIGIKFHGIKVNEDTIIDGHHRYLASQLAEITIEIFPSPRTSATKTTNWESIEFDHEDWDTAAKIKMLTAQDAEYNNLSIEEISKQLE